MTWDAGPCLPAADPSEPMTTDELRALLTRLGHPPTTRQHHSDRAASRPQAVLHLVDGAARAPEVTDPTEAI